MSESMPTSQFPKTRIETTNQANLIKTQINGVFHKHCLLCQLTTGSFAQIFVFSRTKTWCIYSFFYPMTCFQNELEISLVKYKAQRQRSLKYGSQFWLKLTFLTPSYHEFNLPTRFTVDEKIIMFTLEMTIKAPH